MNPLPYLETAALKWTCARCLRRSLELYPVKSEAWCGVCAAPVYLAEMRADYRVARVITDGAGVECVYRMLAAAEVRGQAVKAYLVIRAAYWRARRTMPALEVNLKTSTVERKSTG